MILMPPGKLWISVIASTLDKAEVYILSYSMGKNSLYNLSLKDLRTVFLMVRMRVS